MENNENPDGPMSARARAVPSRPVPTVSGEQQPADPIVPPLRSVREIPASRSAPQAARDVSAERLQALRALPYKLYLQTPEWLSTRNRALQRAKYHCERCDAPRDLQVHHLSYARLGAELDEDLQVLCRGCHLGHHVVALEDSLKVYFKVVSDALRTEQFSSVSDLVEVVKVRCARLRIPYADGQVRTVIARMKDERLVTEVPKKYRELLDQRDGYQPYTHAEACALLTRHGLAVRSMPSVPRFTRRQADTLVVIGQIKALYIEQKRRCREIEEIAAVAEARAREGEQQ